MRLIYIYINKFRNIFNQEIILTDTYDIAYDPTSKFPNALSISKKESASKAALVYKDSLLSNVHMIVGKTGAGKTNFFQLIGMPEDERTRNSEADDSYFLLYETDGAFVVELYNIMIEKSLTLSDNSEKINNDLSLFPEYIQKYSRSLDSMHCYRFKLNGNLLSDLEPINSNINLGNDNTYIFNGYERHAFAFCPYEEIRLENNKSNNKWFPRINAEYHKTALWNSCRFLKEYIDSFEKGNLKRKAALVIKCNNWADTIKQHLDDKLKKHDYWTFRENIRQEEIDKVTGKATKNSKRPAIRHQFVHDLWTDFALYLREWISYIQMYPVEIPEENLDSSGTKDVYQESIDYYYEKQFEEQGKTSGKRDKNPIDPTVLPDYKNISILKRIEWLSMWIDRRGDGVPYSLLWQIYGDIKDIGEILDKFDDKYFTNDTFTLPIEEMYTYKNKKLVEDLFERIEQYRPDDTGIFTKELLPYSFSCISSGEYQFAKVMGGIEEYCVKLSVGGYGNHPNLIYLLDEPETYMHPELCRTFLYRLDKVLKERTGESDIQIMISTHSPLLLSDVLPNQITRLDLDPMGKCIIKNGTKKAYFGANIHTILADGFFLDYTIGEYSRHYLQDRLNWLKTIIQKNSLTERDRTELNQLKDIVSVIGDDLIRSSFEILLKQTEDKT